MGCSFLSDYLIKPSDDELLVDPKVMQHVEGCSICQSQLETIAISESPWLNEVRMTLRRDGLPEPLTESSVSAMEKNGCKVVPSPDGIDVESIPLDYLDDPIHPELIGRLGRYDIEAVLGSGGMGVVFRARDTDLQRVVAIKVLAKHLAHYASARLRFAREAQAAAAIIHPNVISIFDVHSEHNPPYLVMKFVSGPSLQARIDRDGPLTVLESLRIAHQVAAGLAAAHAQGLVHRDIKPANILLEERTDRVHLSDFGLARTADDASITRTGYIAGTPHYMSPEQADGQPIDGRSDLFSLGSVLYFMLTGRPPFRAEGAMATLKRVCSEPHRDVRQLEPLIPVDVSRVVNRLLSKNASQRYASAAELELILNQLLTRYQGGQLTRNWRFGFSAIGGRLRSIFGSRKTVATARPIKPAYRWIKRCVWSSFVLCLIGVFASFQSDEGVFSYFLQYDLRRPTARNAPSRPGYTVLPVSPYTIQNDSYTSQTYANSSTHNFNVNPAPPSVAAIQTDGFSPTATPIPARVPTLNQVPDGFWSALSELKAQLEKIESASRPRDNNVPVVRQLRHQNADLQQLNQELDKLFIAKEK
jgi:serine/threonine protein kinase